MKRRARIIATIGPTSADEATLEQLVSAGVDVFRLNFSHGDLEFHGQVIDRLQAIRRRSGVPFAILQDLPGPKIRVGRLEAGQVELEAGAVLRLTSHEVVGTADLVPVNYPWLEDDIHPGSQILLDDGSLELRVTGAEPGALLARVVRGGTLLERKGVNVPTATLRWPALTEHDGELLRFGLQRGVDLVALSFVRHANDATPVRAVMAAERRRVPLIAKIEKPQALDQLAGIVRRFDAIMVARGDLGVELAPELVPMAQKRIVAVCRAAGKPAITATQMLESMTHAARPTRAEAADVANAVLDGSDALMLSAETSVGRYPVVAVETMDRIIRVAEQSREAPARVSYSADSSRAVAHAACVLADELGAAALAVVTRTGRSARLVSNERPRTPVVVFTDQPSIARQLALWWGLTVIELDLPGGIDATSPLIDARLVAAGLAKPDDRIVVAGATPMASGATTNFLAYHTIPKD